MPEAGTKQRAWRARAIRTLLLDTAAGLIVSAVPLVYCISFSALIFNGDLGVGLAAGLWCLLCGTVISSLLIGLLTSIPPVTVGPDPTVMATMTVLVASVAGAVKSVGGTP